MMMLMMMTLHGVNDNGDEYGDDNNIMIMIILLEIMTVHVHVIRLYY